MSSLGRLRAAKGEDDQGIQPQRSGDVLLNSVRRQSQSYGMQSFDSDPAGDQAPLTVDRKFHFEPKYCAKIYLLLSDHASKFDIGQIFEF